MALDNKSGYAHWNLGQVLYLKGDTAAAIAEYEKRRALDDDPQILGLLGRAYADGDRTVKAIELIQNWKPRPNDEFVRGYVVALVYIGLGDKTKSGRIASTRYRGHATWMPPGSSRSHARSAPAAIRDLKPWLTKSCPMSEFKRATAAR